MSLDSGIVSKLAVDTKISGIPVGPQWQNFGGYRIGSAQAFGIYVEPAMKRNFDTDRRQNYLNFAMPQKWEYSALT